MQNNQIELQNKNYMEMLYRYSKNEKIQGINMVSLSPGPVKKSVNQSFSQVGGSVMMGKGEQRGHSPSPVPHAHRQGISHLVVAKGNRNLTLSQLKKTIEQIYLNKIKYDKKNFEGHIGLQTMHQFLFTHLNQKYGLKVCFLMIFRI